MNGVITLSIINRGTLKEVDKISYVKLKKIYKKYNDNEKFALKNFNLNIDKGEFIVILGPSGSGKSTLLEIICGFESIDEGNLELDNKVINNELPKDRDVAMVFQDYALFPHMTVYENISFGMKVRKVDKKRIEEKVKWACEILGLQEYLQKKPKQLSGGQRQRVALARAMVRDAKLFLMDEPLSNLDSQLRYSTSNEIINLHRKINATTIYVTHDHGEALSMADRIVVLKDGLIQQIGKPNEIYENPSNLFVATFIGKNRINVFNAKVESQKINIENTITLPRDKVLGLEDNKEYIIGIRPENIKIAQEVELDSLKATIDKVDYIGGECLLYLNHNNTKFNMKYTEGNIPKVGDSISIVFDFNKLNIFDINTEKNIRRDKNEENY